MATFVVKDMFAKWLCDTHCDLANGRIRFLSDDHREEFLRNEFDGEDYLDPVTEKVKLDFVREKSVVISLSTFEQRLDEDEYADDAIVVLEFNESYDTALDFVQQHMENLNREIASHEISFCKVPTYVHRSSQVETMFNENIDFEGYRDYFFVDEWNAFCFLRLQKKNNKRKFEALEDDDDDDDLTGCKVQVEVNPDAIDDEKRVMPPMELYVTDYDRKTCDPVLKKSTSMLVRGQSLHFFRVNVGTPPMVRMYTINRDTGAMTKKFLPLTEVVVERNVVTKYQDNLTCMHAPRMKNLMNDFLHDFDADFDGDSIVGLQEVYEIFTCYCMREHGYPLLGIEMHAWFFHAVSDLYSGWIVDRNGKKYIRCMSFDLDSAYQHCVDKGWTLRSLPYL